MENIVIEQSVNQNEIQDKFTHYLKERDKLKELKTALNNNLKEDSEYSAFLNEKKEVKECMDARKKSIAEGRPEVKSLMEKIEEQKTKLRAIKEEVSDRVFVKKVGGEQLSLFNLEGETVEPVLTVKF